MTKIIQSKTSTLEAQVKELTRLVSTLATNQGAKTSKVDQKVSEWTTLAESGKGKRTTLAPEDKTGKYTSRGIVISRFAKSIFVPADQFREFVAEVEIALHKLEQMKLISSA